MGLLYCLGWLEPSGPFRLSESRAPSRLVLAPGLPRGGPRSEASVCEEKTEVWEKEELKVSPCSGVPGVPGLALASGGGWVLPGCCWRPEQGPGSGQRHAGEREESS